MFVDDPRTIRRARKLAWHRTLQSDARRLLAAAEAMAEASTDARDYAIAQAAIADARAILSSGGMRLCEAYRDAWFPGSEVPLRRYEAYKRAHAHTAVRVGFADGRHVWWYRDAYYVAHPQVPADDIERFAGMEEADERRNLERFRARVAALSATHDERRRAWATTDRSGRVAADEPRRSVLAASVVP